MQFSNKEISCLTTTSHQFPLLSILYWNVKILTETVEPNAINEVIQLHMVNGVKKSHSKY